MGVGEYVYMCMAWWEVVTDLYKLELLYADCSVLLMYKSQSLVIFF